MIEMNNIYNMDCLIGMDKMIEQRIQVDAIICDPPYGTTACKWDSIIPFDEMWLRLNKLIKPNGAIVLFGAEPFSSLLRVSNLKNYKYDWIWKKSLSPNYMNAKNCPLKKHELISVFSLGTIANGSNRRMEYFPQGIKEVNKRHKRPSIYETEHKFNRPSHKTDRVITHEGYPDSILEFPFGNNNSVHPTQKPIELMEYLVKTYTNENELVLDFTIGSGTTMVACENINRNFIGFELDKGYFDIATKRLEAVQGSLF